jgi:hypothetical protein
MDELRTRMKTMSTTESKLFALMKSHLHVVVYDQKSESLEPDSTLMKFLQLLKQDGVDSSLLSGGYTGFVKFIEVSGYNPRDFIEIGVGEAPLPPSIVSSPAAKIQHPPRTNCGNSLPQQRTNSGSNLVRSAYQVGLGARGGGKVRDAVKNFDSPPVSPILKSNYPSDQRGVLQERQNDGIARNVSDYVC